MENIMIGQEETGNKFPSHFGELYDSMPEKFGKRNSKVKPLLCIAGAIVCVLLVIFPGVIPVNGWIVRVIAVIGAVWLGMKSLVAGFEVYSKTSGGVIKKLKTKKFLSDSTDLDEIIDAFRHHDFKALSEMPGGDDQPVQLHIEEDAKGKEFYCILTTYVSEYKIKGLAEPIILSGEEYENNECYIRQM